MTLGLQALVVVVVAALVLDELGLPGPLLAAVVVLGIVVVAVVPELRWRRWRYAIRDEEIELRHGTLVARHTLVPIRRVQHVDTEQGPLQGSFDVATVTFHTAAGEVEIPALRAPDADRVRRRVAELAKALDDV